MPVLIYYTQFDQPLPESRFAALLQACPEDIQQKVGRFRRWEDAHAALLGKHLLLQAMAALGRTVMLDKLCFTAVGRPYLEQQPDFNISHAGNMVACAVSTTGRTGIDLEEIRPVELEDFREQFTAEEWTQICAAKDPLLHFYQYWTMKEAVAKANGVGIVALPAVKILSPAEVGLFELNWHLHPVALREQYVCYIATDKAPQSLIVEEIFF